MDNNRYKRCEHTGCVKQARYGLPNINVVPRKIYCSDHRKIEMVK